MALACGFGGRLRRGGFELNEWCSGQTDGRETRSRGREGGGVERGAAAAVIRSAVYAGTKYTPRQVGGTSQLLGVG